MANKVSSVSWEAEEYVVRSHNAWWFIGLFVVTAGLCALAIWLNAWSFFVLIIVSALALLVFVLRPPRKIQYRLDNKGLTEGTQLHPYSDFRAFGILQEDEHYSAILIPTKRLGLSVKVYFPEKNGEVIVDNLGAHLPMEEVRLDFMDKIVKFLRI